MIGNVLDASEASLEGSFPARRNEKVLARKEAPQTGPHGSVAFLRLFFPRARRVEVFPMGCNSTGQPMFRCGTSACAVV